MGPFDETDADRSVRKYCLECGWSVSLDDADSIEDVSRRTLEHFVETGHTIESTSCHPLPFERGQGQSQGQEQE
ncbi:hypothetical protein [Natrialbaceae archaeon AArc-T1-2]|uniref:hypothetical protein n=1 Tax=Natrialbaceae archaeon AArc-T1-2 TaxID=3053904 RepID=UPI00255AEE50|nr:hypothetical protein [Natrialbaceae archaeon AArc-T1-2]WIV66832.1 hypothetical protein QQ977_14225 [Natrialbaceae archaeon AArc-T1-2]